MEDGWIRVLGFEVGVEEEESSARAEHDSGEGREWLGERGESDLNAVGPKTNSSV